jgi:NADH:ubiquinone oxidoreductase subunit D
LSHSPIKISDATLYNWLNNGRVDFTLTNLPHQDAFQRFMNQLESTVKSIMIMRKSFQDIKNYSSKTAFKSIFAMQILPENGPPRKYLQIRSNQTCNLPNQDKIK